MSLFDAVNHWQRIHFTGIGGVGMAALALICDDVGIEVSGSDLVESSHTRLLQDRGIMVAIGDDAGRVPEAVDLLVYSSAVPESDAERRSAEDLRIPQIRRGEFLGQLSKLAAVRVAIAGSHGKTTTTAMIAHVLRSNGLSCAYAVGGLINGWPAPASAGDGETFVFEVDESDGTQVAVAATHGVITNLDDDHCWSVGGVESLHRIFVDFADRAQIVFAGESNLLRGLLASHGDCRFLPEGASDGLPVVGAHNRTNGAMAVQVAMDLGISADSAVSALASFAGVDRRLSVRLDAAVVMVEDYAHHPTELAAAIAAVRERWPRRPLRLVLQPHRYERVARYGAEFAEVLAAVDFAIVTKPFDAWIDDAELADPRQLLAQIGERGRYSEASWEVLSDEIAAEVSDGDLVLIAGAGTISKLPPLLIQALARRDVLD